MGDIREPRPVKLFVGLLAGREAWLGAAGERLAPCFGAVDLRSSLIPFDHTDYYEPQMGPGLLRQFVACQPLVDPGELATIKLRTNALEAELAEELEADVPRPVNLDPGYLDDAKLVLATTKNYSHRIYIGQGIYAEVTLTWHHGAWQPTPWTYRDYRSEPYRAFFAEARARYLEQRRHGR
ncbi:MAG: DUF4416 family protein [Candidatus Brocadiia bacterium]